MRTPNPTPPTTTPMTNPIAPARAATLAAACVALAWLAVAPRAAHAADAAAAPSAAASSAEQVIVPEVDRRDIHRPRYPSNDFEVGVFGGMFSTQNFGSAGAGGLRLGYHVTEDFFVEAALGQTKASDRSFRQVLPGGIFSTGTETLRYRDISLGYNVLPGEVFIGSKTAKASALYLIAGLGTTSLNSQRMQTANFGMGMRVFLRDWFALRADVRDHIFTYDLLGKRQLTQNPELTAGLSFLF